MPKLSWYLIEENCDIWYSGVTYNWIVAFNAYSLLLNCRLCNEFCIIGLFCSCLPWHEVFYDLLDHVSNCLNDVKNQSIFPLLGLLYDVKQFKSGEPVSVADVSINQVSYIYSIITCSI